MMEIAGLFLIIFRSFSGLEEFWLLLWNKESNLPTKDIAYHVKKTIPQECLDRSQMNRSEMALRNLFSFFLTY